MRFVQLQLALDDTVAGVDLKLTCMFCQRIEISKGLSHAALSYDSTYLASWYLHRHMSVR